MIKQNIKHSKKSIKRILKSDLTKLDRFLFFEYFILFFQIFCFADYKKLKGFQNEKIFLLFKIILF